MRFSLFIHYFYKKISPDIHIYLGLGFEFRLQRITDLAFMCPLSVDTEKAKDQTTRKRVSQSEAAAMAAAVVAAAAVVRLPF